MISEKSCGGIVFRRERNRILYLVIKHKLSSGGHWDFPKGHVENGESEEQTALREIYEEVGLKIRFVQGFKESVSYFNHMTNLNKTVVYFLCESLTSEVKYVFDELEDHAWIDFHQALTRLTYDNAKNILKKVDSFLKAKFTPYELS